MHTSSNNFAKSLRSAVAGLVPEFVNAQGITCALTHSAITDLVFALADYREEGTGFYPEVYVVLSPTSLRTLCPTAQPIPLGQGKLDAHAVRRALKACAPLASHGWGMFLHPIQSKVLEFGVFRSRTSFLSLNAADQMLADEDIGSPVIMLRHTRLGCVELVGRKGERFEIRLTADKDEIIAPASANETIATHFASSVVDPKLREAIARQFARLIADACRGSHGALIAVLSGKKPVPHSLTDGIILPKPLDLGAHLSRAIRIGDEVSADEYMSAHSLAQGMLKSDGIVVVDTLGRIRGYRVFVKATASEAKKMINLSGGARSRAFAVLSQRCNKDLVAAMIWSQDGLSSVAGGER